MSNKNEMKTKIIWKNRNPEVRKDMSKVTKIDSSFFPSKMTNGRLDKKTGVRSAPKPKKQWTESNSIEVHGETFWLVKKKPDGSASIFYHAYNVETRNNIIVRETKSEIMQELLDHYMDYMRDDF